jgi:hypothetical protein
MGSAVRIEIKSASVRLSAVKAAAEKEEHVRYDGFGEILSGGNRFVQVGYSDEARAGLAAPHLEAVIAAAAKATGNSLIPVETAPAYMIGVPSNGGNGTYFALWGDSHIIEGSPAELAARIGTLLLEA